MGKARQSRHIVSHQPLPQFSCGRAIIIHYTIIYCMAQNFEFPAIRQYFPYQSLVSYLYETNE